jgi:outer membrane receptor protein involved in Fe transport
MNKKRILCTLFLSTLTLLLGLGNLAVVLAQETAPNEFTLEEITVTAEKRAVNLQSVAVSVVALDASELAEMGKTTTAQILETVPNLTYRAGSTTNPDGNIAIRGVQRTQQSGGNQSILPSTTAIYVDGIYQGIGGNFDVNRVEVLRGPQGTLYGRSATGGVVSFFTNDPKLSEFGGSASVELGSASLKNIQAAINAPIGSKVALRLAGHYYSRDGLFDAEGGKTETKEGRLKALFQPTDALSIILAISDTQTINNGGGWQARLATPTKINLKGAQTVISVGAPNKYRQASVNVNYDFGGSTLTYIGGYHDYDSTGLGAEAGKGEALHRDLTKWPTDYYHTEEIRWASDTEGKLTWLVGANYFKHAFDTSLFSVQTRWPPDAELTQANGFMAPIFGQITKGSFNNYGAFTEETYKVQDNFRITAGLRFDKTKLDQEQTFSSNTNITSTGNSKLPATFASATHHDIKNYNNVTYKLRLEYDMTPDNMIYALTATGFMPGFFAISPKPFPPPVTFKILELDQQKLTSYEIGTKNQFLNNTFRLNADAFYYDYAGYVESINIAVAGPPNFVPMPVPLKMYGLEIDGQYLITMNDKVSFDAGWESIKIDKFPIISGFNTKDYMALSELPGNPQFKATLGYDHTFIFGNGSSLVPRAQLVYTSGYYLVQMTQLNVAAGEKPYNYQDAYTIGNLSLVWSSADSKYSVSGYVRNAFDKLYKSSVSLTSSILNSAGQPAIGVTPGDPRTFGVIMNAKF